jgi:phospholipid/cholesterol/gamma-HCH transport system substrate-binding protein
METRANYALIGALVIAAALLTAAFVLWFGQAEFRRDFKNYDIVFDGPVSLEQGAAVRYIGIKVGEVQEIRIDRADPSKVRARIRVSREAPIRRDSTATIQLAGITGITFVQISAGTGPVLEPRPGEPVPVIQSERTLVDQIVAGGAQALGRANLTFDRINSTVLTDENLAALSATIRNVEKLTEQLAADDGLIVQAGTTLEDLSRATRAFEEASRDLARFSRSADAAVIDAGASLNRVASDMSEIADSARETLTASTAAMQSAAEIIDGPARLTFENANDVSQDLRLLINRLDRMAREIERNPQGFVVGEPLPYEDRRR